MMSDVKKVAILTLIVEAKGTGSSDGDDRLIVVVSGKAMEQNGLWRQMISDSSGLQVIFMMKRRMKERVEESPDSWQQRWP
jgi:hypothetical protein